MSWDAMISFVRKSSRLRPRKQRVADLRKPANRTAVPAPTDAVQLGGRAKSLLDDPVLQLAFERVAGDLAATWRNSALGSRDEREEAYRLLWALEAVRSKLRGFTGNAALVAAELKRKEAEAARRPAPRVT